jgi:hypothetical protein
VITGATARSDYNNPQEKQTTLQYLNAARTVFQTLTETIVPEAFRARSSKCMMSECNMVADVRDYASLSKMIGQDGLRFLDA